MGIRNTKQMFEDMTGKREALEERVANLETSEYSIIRFFHASSLFLDGVTVTGTYTSDTVFSFGSVPSENVRGVLGTLWTDLETVDYSIYIDSADENPDAYSQRYYWNTTTAVDRQVMSQFVMIPVNSEGKFKLQVVGTANAVVYLALFGYLL